MNKSIIEFYVMANNLKNVVRKGWMEVGIPKEKIESVADHIYGTMVLSLGIIEEKKLDLDVAKLFKMIILKELSKAISLDETSVLEPNSMEATYEKTYKIIESLDNSSNLKELYEEYENKSCEEARFAYKVSKLESDLQAKLYEKSGDFKIENAKRDIEHYPEEVKSQITEIKHASDGWLIFDRGYYEGDEYFMNFSKEIEEME